MWKNLEDIQPKAESASPKELHWYGTVEGTQFKPAHLRDFLEALRNFNGMKVHFLMETTDRRSEQHSRYYFGMLRALSMETGYDVEELHELSKRECNTQIGHVLNKNTGEIREKIFGGSTRRMKAGDFAQYIENVKRYWAEQGYVLADEYWED